MVMDSVTSISSSRSLVSWTPLSVSSGGGGGEDGKSGGWKEEGIEGGREGE